MLALCETVGCRRQNLLDYFGEASGPCGNCDTCLEAPETWDGLVPAQKLLSTIVRLQRERGQAFGAGHLIDILRGASTDRIRQQGHDKLSTYGLGADLTDQDWRSVDPAAAGARDPGRRRATTARSRSATPPARAAR